VKQTGQLIWHVWSSRCQVLVLANSLENGLAMEKERVGVRKFWKRRAGCWESDF